MSQKPILIVDDVDTHLTLFTATLEAAGHTVLPARSQAEALALIDITLPGIALVDLVLPDGDGIALIKLLKDRDPTIKLIAITAFASVDRAVSAMRNGAEDFLVKPIEPDQLKATIANTLAGRSIGQYVQPYPVDDVEAEGHVGSSSLMQDIYSTIRAVAGSAASVFITGENGTGKVKAAAAIHNQSGFQDGAFVKLDCSTAAPDTIEAELLGQIGTREIPEKIGAAELAYGGTLLLDEICTLSLPMQARLLNMLQSGMITPIGATAGRPAEFRLICTSTVDPRAEVQSGRFRADLFYRLNVVPIHLPPLRARGLDVVEIAETELDRLCAREGREFRTLSTEVKAIFLDHAWPGNIRELMNVLWNVIVLHDGPVVNVTDLPPYLRGAQRSQKPSHLGGTSQVPENPFAGKTLAEIERNAVEAAISHAGGSIPTAARSLGVSPSTLYRKLEGWGRPVRGGRKF
ncbi:sigma-54 dependent transcriptional regulator [Celeribacter baekdonensis]|uniref:sigma-54-dependent transcriptional regulator n=1 Tax=Celeribacter baekdonensis TaxID=875171 RepID=UPI0030D7BD6B|tara:strand:+ start:76290 stop:77675 length:1386 start_codon:yes stop_codon:yes gene_type:complete